MKKFVSTDLGGAPIHKNDLKSVFNEEIWAGIQTPHTYLQAGTIFYGCSVSPNGSNFDITEGVVFLDHEFMRLPAYVNQSFPKYIVPATPITESRTFADASTHPVIQTRSAELVGSAPGAGHYIAITDLSTHEKRRHPISQDSIQLIIDGGGAAITVGQKGHIIVKWECAIVGMTLLADAVGSIVINLWKDTYANFPPTVGDSICATVKPTLSTAQKTQTTNMAGWTTGLAKGDILAYNIESVSGISRVTLDLPVLKY